MRLPVFLLAPLLSLNLFAATTATNELKTGPTKNELEIEPAKHELKIEPTKIHLAGPVVAGPRDADIVRLVGRVLERNHYLQMPIDKEVSAKFFDRYFEAWDPQRLHFLESDVKDFQIFRDKLDYLTLERGDSTPANLIYTRFRDRLRQRMDYVKEILPREKFDFDGDEKVLINRKDAPRPKTLDEAKQLWRERLRYEMLQEKLNKEKPEEIVKIISRRYTRMQRSYEELDSDDVLQTYLTSLAHIYDPHSDYFNKATLENFSIGMRLSLFGIGAVLSSEDGYCKIVSLTPEAPAAKSNKIKPGDRIVFVAQGTNPPVDVVDMKLNKVVEQIRGPKGSEVRLTIIPADAPDSSVRKQVSIIRDEIKLEDQEAKAKLIEVPDDKGQKQRLGYIDLPSFYSDFDAKDPKLKKSTTTDVAKLVKKLKAEKMDGLILDVRRNGGGSLEEAINLTGLFIKQGTVVQVKDPDGSVVRDDDKDSSVLYDGPLVVLTSRFSASASEIMAGALQDYGRALIVGDVSTHGKGTVQSLVNLSPYFPPREGQTNVVPGALKVTIRKFYRASGASTQLEGVKPDLILPSINNEADVGEKALENPLVCDNVKPADFEKLNRVAPFLADLKRLSDVRVAKDKDFFYISEDIEQFKKNKAEKSVSLNEAKRVKEKEEAKAKSEVRKQEILARHTPDPTVYEITLKLADKPGLPPAMVKSNLTASAKSPHGSVPIAKSPVISRTTNTNQTTAATSSTKADPGDEEDTAGEEGIPSRDPNLEEAKRILVDYIRLMTQKGSLTTAGK